MSSAAFDTLKLAKRLEAAGMPPLQAESFAEALSEVMTTEFATKADLKQLELATRADIRELRSWCEAEFAKVRAEIAQSKNETIRWMMGISLAQTAIVVGALLRISG